MPVDILITVVGTSIIQSIFGVGVLLFGTPILLALGYDFVKAITILLPISLTINFFQVAKDYKRIDLDFYKKMLLYTIPFVVLFLFIATTSKINIGMIVGFFLIFVAIKDYSAQLRNILKVLIKQERSYLVAMGIVHGTTNLGGSLLTAIIHNKKYEKDVTRVTVAASYGTFALFQIATLFFSSNLANIRLLENGLYLIGGVVVFFLTETLVYMEIDNQKYSKYFALFLFCSGVLLCVKAIY